MSHMAKVPLYRLQGHGDHFYTTNATERDNAISQYGYTSEGIACYVDTDADAAYSARDELAIAAMQSILIGRHFAGAYVGNPAKQIPLDVALAYQMADAMIRYRTRT